MAVLTADFLIPWPSTAASIPAGFTRNTAFDDRYPQGSDSAYTAAANGGAATHNHTYTHTHIGVAHSHTVSGSSITSAGTINYPDHPLGSNTLARGTHGHPNFTSNTTVVTYTDTTPTVTAGAMQPASFRVIWIQPNDATHDVPNGALTWTDLTSAPSGYRLADGNGGAPNIVDRFLIGAAAAGDGGGTVGADTHTHAVDDHLHARNTHTHASTAVSAADASEDDGADLSSDATSRRLLHHNITLPNTGTSGNTNNATSVTLAATSSLPAYITLLGVQNNSGGESTPDKTILPYIATAASLPTNWVLCDGTGGTLNCTNKQIRATATGGSVGATGGANTHSHTSTHTHTDTSHTHTVTDTGPLLNQVSVLSGAGKVILNNSAGHRTEHTWTISTETPTMSASATASSTDDGRYLYRTVVFLRYNAPVTQYVTIGGALQKDKVAYAA